MRGIGRLGRWLRAVGTDKAIHCGASIERLQLCGVTSASWPAIRRMQLLDSALLEL